MFTKIQLPPRNEQESFFSYNAFLFETERLISYFLSEEILAEKNSQKPSKKKSLSSSQKDAASIIQNAWTIRKFQKEFWNNGYETYQALTKLQGNTNIRFLAELMYGRTIAGMHKVPKNLSKKFPIENPHQHTKPFYHRSDKLTGGLFDNFLKQFITDINHEKYTYIPVVLLTQTPINYLLDSYLPSAKPHLELLTKNGHNIGVLKFRKKISNLILHQNTVTLIHSLGVVASPWELSIALTKFNNPDNNNHNHYSATSNAHSVLINDRLLKNLPTSIIQLKESKLITKLTQIANHSDYSTQILAKCLLRLIDGLPGEAVLDKENRANLAAIVQRIGLFLNMAVTLQKNNYRDFAISLYSIVHEISLIIFISQQTQQPCVTFSAFEEETFNALRHFGLEKPEGDADYRYIAYPASSGSNGFSIALSLAKRAIQNPKVKFVGPLYFEFENFKIKSSSEKPDIYIISCGPIVDSEKINYGTNINKLIQSRIIKNKQKLDKPIIIIIDTTTSLYSELKINPEYQELIYKGELSIICFESHQKFGLIHTDQAQYGRVWGICSKQVFSESLLNDYREKAQADFNQHLDMMIGAYINIQCSQHLEAIKDRHFLNGYIYKLMLNHFWYFTGLGWKFKEGQNLSSLGYFIYSQHFYHLSRLQPLIESIFMGRSSFGHFQTTYSPIGSSFRLSADASDPIDTLIEGTQLLLLGQFNLNSMIKFMQDLVKAYLTKPKLEHDINARILFFGIMLNLKHLAYEPKSVNEKALYIIALKEITSHSFPMLADRRAFHDLLTHYQTVKKSYSTQFEKDILQYVCNASKADQQHCYQLLSEFSKSPSNYQIYAKLILLITGLVNIDISENKVCLAIINLYEAGILTKKDPSTFETMNCIHLFLKLLIDPNSQRSTYQFIKVLSEHQALTFEIIEKFTEDNANNNTKNFNHIIAFFVKHNILNKKILNIFCQIPGDSYYIILEMLSSLDTTTVQKRYAAYIGLNNHSLSNNEHLSPLKEELLDLIHSRVLNDFKQLYISQCKLSLFGNTGRSSFGNRVFNNELTSIEEIIEHARTNKPGAAAQALARMRNS